MISGTALLQIPVMDLSHRYQRDIITGRSPVTLIYCGWNKPPLRRSLVLRGFHFKAEMRSLQDLPALSLAAGARGGEVPVEVDFHSAESILLSTVELLC